MYSVTLHATDFDKDRGKFTLPAGIVFFYGCALLLIGVAAACFLDRRHGGVADPGKPRWGA